MHLLPDALIFAPPASVPVYPLMMLLACELVSKVNHATMPEVVATVLRYFTAVKSPKFFPLWLEPGERVILMAALLVGAVCDQLAGRSCAHVGRTRAADRQCVPAGGIRENERFAGVEFPVVVGVIVNFPTRQAGFAAVFVPILVGIEKDGSSDVRLLHFDSADVHSSAGDAATGRADRW